MQRARGDTGGTRGHGHPQLHQQGTTQQGEELFRSLLAGCWKTEGREKTGRLKS